MRSSFPLLLLLAVPAYALSPWLQTPSLCDSDRIPVAGHTGLQRGKSHMAPTGDVRVTFALKLRNVEVLEKTFWSVSDPASPSYGHHWSMQQVDELVAPPPEAVGVVADWLTGCGREVVKVDQSAKGFVVATLSTTAMHNLLGGDHLPSYTVPRAVAAHLAFVQVPTAQRRQPTKPVKAAKHGLAGNLNTDPPSLRSLYNIKDYTATHPNSTQATANFLGEGYSEDDLRFFFECFYMDGEGQKVAKVVGPNHEPSLEASLDIQYLMSIGSGAVTWWWSSDLKDNGGQEPFLEWLVALSNTSDTPWVQSVSYADNEPGVGVAYQTRANQEFMKAGVRGLSILIASGDYGAGCNELKNRFVPEWPSTSPYVTTVGATTLSSALPPVAPAPSSVSEQVGAQKGSGEQCAEFSGGGFSDVWPRPAYQDDAVTTYFNSSHSKLPIPSYFNKTGRAVPDVSAVGTLFSLIVDQNPSVAEGTSASTPVWAGVVTLLNDVRFKASKPPLGFLNPWLYSLPASHPGALTDITTGHNTGCGLAPTGFVAAKGYDPVSGLGSPNFALLSKAALEV